MNNFNTYKIIIYEGKLIKKILKKEPQQFSFLSQTLERVG